MKILLVEDDELVVEELLEVLQDQRYTVDVAKDGQEGWELGTSCPYDLFLLDVMLPKLNGIALCQRWRSQGLQTPILLMTAQDTNTSEIGGLDAGADDYITKPLNRQVLLARIRALLRRGQTEPSLSLVWGNLCLDPSTCEVTCNGQLLRLTPKEYGLLELFLRNPQRVYSRSVILDHLWTIEASPGEETVTAHIKGLRQKLKAAGIVENPIETVYGIGYRLKPSPQAELEQQPASTFSAESAQDSPQRQVQVKVSKIWERVQEKLNRRVSTLEQASSVLLKSRLKSQHRLQAQQEAHKLAGSLGMFDLDEGSRLAREIERLFQIQSLTKAQKRQLTDLIVSLRQELQHTAIKRLTAPLKQPTLLIVSEDLSFADELAAAAQVKELDSQIANPVEARAWVAAHRPEVAFLDLGCNGEPNSIQLGLLEELKASTPPVPAIVASPNGLLNRVQIARLGGRRFLPKPVSPAQGVEAIAQVLQQTRYHTATVAVVDDDPQILLALRHLLQPWGLKLISQSNALQFWEQLATTQPDLLILDIEMPQISGLELCQLVRNDSRWTDLPVLFLTAHNDVQTMQQVFAAGADDFVTKPIVGPELVTRILNRLERSHLARSRTQLDALTGVANYRFSTQEFTRLLEMAKHDCQPLCFAVLHLDGLQLINEQYSHALANQALKQFAHLLRQTFQSEDRVARWGGAEFVVAMYAMTERDGVQRLLDVRDKLPQIAVTEHPAPLQLTFRAGVVEYTEGAELQTLYHRALTLLQQKAASGQICTHALSSP